MRRCGILHYFCINSTLRQSAHREAAMAVICIIHLSGFILVSVLGSGMVISGQALTPSPCQVQCPSEYSYFVDSVTGEERNSANCTTEVDDDDMNMEPFVRCNGSPFRLTDSDLGSVRYNSSDFYVWRAGETVQRLLFTFPTTVQLSSVTLHYYSDSTTRGLSKLRFSAVPDDFELRDGLRTIYSQTTVETMPPSSNKQTGPTSIEINLDFITKKLLMLKFLSNFQFAVSEVEFFSCNATTLTISESTMSSTQNVIFDSDQELTWRTVPTTEKSTLPEHMYTTDLPPLPAVNAIATDDSDSPIEVVISVRESIAWTVAGIMTVLFVGFLIIHMTIMLCRLKKRYRSKKMESSQTPNEMASNPCYNFNTRDLTTEEQLQDQEYPVYERINWEDIINKSSRSTSFAV